MKVNVPKTLRDKKREWGRSGIPTCKRRFSRSSGNSSEQHSANNHGTAIKASIENVLCPKLTEFIFDASGWQFF